MVLWILLYQNYVLLNDWKYHQFGQHMFVEMNENIIYKGNNSLDKKLKAEREGFEPSVKV